MKDPLFLPWEFRCICLFVYTGKTQTAWGVHGLEEGGGESLASGTGS